MIKRNLVLLVLVLAAFACTKEVPESDRKLAKSPDESSIREVIEKYYMAYNTGDIETAVNFFDVEYREVAPDSDDFLGYEELREELYQFRKQYPEGKWEFTIEELTVQNDFAYVISKNSFLLPDPVEAQMNPSYSERSIKILKRNKPEGWKIFRSFSVPAFSYDY